MSQSSERLAISPTPPRLSPSAWSRSFWGPSLVQYISTILTLRSGDGNATGPPEGVGHASAPHGHLSDGVKLVTRISHFGELAYVARSR